MKASLGDVETLLTEEELLGESQDCQDEMEENNLEKFQIIQLSDWTCSTQLLTTLD